MKSRVGKIIWGVVAVGLSVMILLLVKPDLLVSSGVTKSVTDLSSVHGEGYMQEQNDFIVTSEDSYFIFDLQKLNHDYTALRLVFNPEGFDEKQDVEVDVDYSAVGTMAEEEQISGVLSAGESVLRLEQNYGTKQYLRIHVNLPVGSTYTLQAIEIEQSVIELNIISLFAIAILTLSFYILINFLHLDSLICKFLKYIGKGWNAVIDRMEVWETRIAVEKQGRKIEMLLLFGSQLLIVLLFISMKKLVYATNDDTTMLAIAGGGYGKASPYVINMHYVVGTFLKILFDCLPGINWMTILFLAILIGAIYCIDVILVEKEQRNFIYFLGVMLVTDLCFWLVLGYFSFTVVAYFAGIAGTICLAWGIKGEENKGCWIAIGIFWIIWAVLIRGETLKTVLLMLLLLSVYEAIKKHNVRYLFLEIVIGAVMMCGIKSNMWLLNRDPVEQTFLEWGELRSEVLDGAQIPYSEEEFQKKGISEAQYNALYNAFYYIRDAVSIDVLNDLQELNTNRTKYNVDVIGFIQEHFEYFSIHNDYKLVYKWIFAIIVCIGFTFGTKETRIRTFLIWLSTAGIEFVYYMIQRPLYRIVMPTYILAIVLLLILQEYESKKVEVFFENKIDIKKIYMTGCLLLGLGTLVTYWNTDFNYQNAAYSAERKKVLAYMTEHSDTLFLAGDPAAFSIGVCDSVWNYPGKVNKWNLIGNWEIYSVPSNELVTAYGYNDVDNIALEAVNNEKILILTTMEYGFEERSEYILDLFEQYYGIRPEFEKVDDICVNQIDENTKERWAAYKLVYSAGE